ncbi:MAG: ATP synthase subunit I [Proteocatella sp.]
MLIVFITGIGFGIIFFGGLHYTVKLITKVRNPALLIAGSLIIRMAVLVFGFYYIRDGSYLNMPVALMGVILVRIVMTQTSKRQGTSMMKKE